ncbi:MAG: hypothetical protein LBN02_01770 [Oscillospiraceae bacterium]|jgi:hypothetical protein|nr:hypothetical protein [Oscillospiraceae bacterium]
MKLAHDSIEIDGNRFCGRWYPHHNKSVRFVVKNPSQRAEIALRNVDGFSLNHVGWATVTFAPDSEMYIEASFAYCEQERLVLERNIAYWAGKEEARDSNIRYAREDAAMYRYN